MKGEMNEVRKLYLRNYIMNHNYEYYPISDTVSIRLRSYSIKADFKFVCFRVPKEWIMKKHFNPRIHANLIFKEAMKEKQFLSLSFSKK